MAIAESDTTVGQIVNEVANELDKVSADVQQWGEAVERALEATPGEAAPVVPDPVPAMPGPPPGLLYTKPAPEPVRPDLGFDDPAVPQVYTPAQVDRFAKPSDARDTVSFDEVGTTYEPGPKPTLPIYTSHTVVVPDLEPMPAISGPAPVALTSATPPVFDGITLPSFAVSINPANLPALQDGFDFNEDPFAPEVLDEIKTEIRRVYAGGTIIPQWVWDGVWSKAAGNLKRQERAAIREAQQEHAARGWMMPGIVANARAAEARQKAAEAISELTQANVTKQAEAHREDLWKAIETGMAIEALLERVSNQANDRALRAAVEANNAGIAVYNAAVQAYQITEIAAKDLLIKLKDLELRGSLAELQEFETELKAAGFVLEYDKNLIEVYKAEWSGEDTKAKAYAAYADALRAYVQGQAAAVDAFGKQVESNNMILQGWGLEWDAYLKRLKPVEMRIQAHEARSSHFGRLVQQYQAQAQSEGARVESDLKVEGLWLEQSSQKLEYFKALWQGISTKLDALTKAFATDAQVYAAKGQVEASRVTALNQTYENEIKKAVLDLDAKKAGLQTRLGYWDRWMQTWTMWNTSSAGAYAQLGAAAYSAMNYSLGADGSASYSNQWSSSRSEDTNYNYDMTS